MIIAVTGHRPDKLGGYAPNPTHLALYDLLHRGFRHHRPEKVLTGMALGTDQIAARAARALGIPYVAVLPFLGQESQWPSPSRAEYRDLLAGAAAVEVVCDGGFDQAAFQRRNEWLVNQLQHWKGDFLLAVWDGSPSGTSKTMSYAQRRGARIRRVDPRKLRG